jgi:hypothetical protein
MLEQMPEEHPVMLTPSYRVQALLESRRTGAMTIQEFAARVKLLSTEELIDLSACIVDLSLPLA